MSQILINGGGSGPVPPTVVETLTGNTGGPVGPTGNNIDIVGAGNVVVAGNPGTSTLTVTYTPPATQVFFSAYKSAVTANATGDGSAVGVIFDVAVTNTGAAYNPATGLFTAPVTGLFAFFSSISTDNYGPLHSSYAQTFFGSAQIINSIVINPGTTFIPGIGLLELNSSTIIQMTAGDTVGVAITVNGSTKTVNVYGQALPGYTTWFRGYQIA